MTKETLELRDAIETAPLDKTNRIVKATADYIGSVIELVPKGTITWMTLITNWRKALEIIQLTITFIKNVKEILND